MPTRLIREGLLDSEQIHAAGALSEVLFTRLLLVADDYCRFDGRVQVIRSRCWPIGGPDEKDIFDRLVKLFEVKLLVAYEVDGKPFIYIPKFNQRVRLKRPSKYPEPPQLSTAKPVKCPADDRQVTGTCTPEANANAEAKTDSNAEADIPKQRFPDLTTPRPPDGVGAAASKALKDLKPPGDEVTVEAEDSTPAGLLAAVLNRNGIQANAFHPSVVEWAREGVTVDVLRAAIATARMRKPKPERIPLSYLDPILADARAPKRRSDSSWKADDDEANRLAHELGITKAKSGEDRNTFHRRIEAALQLRARETVR